MSATAVHPRASDRIVTPDPPAAPNQRAASAPRHGATLGIEPLRHRVSGPQAILCALLIAALSILAGSEWHRVFGWGPVGWRIVVAAVLPAALAWVVNRRLPRSVAATVLLSLSLLLILLGLGVTHEGILSIKATADGLKNGWARILDQPLPATTSNNVLVLPVVSVWLASMTATELLMRVTRPVTVVLPPLAAYGLALLFGIGGSGSRLWSSALFLTVALALAGVATWAGPGSGRATDNAAARRSTGGATVRAPGGRLPTSQLAAAGRRTAEVVGCAALAAILAVWIGPALPGVRHHAPYDPRRGRALPSQPAQALNPLVQLSGWAATPDQAVFDVRASRPVDLRLATLDTYDPTIGWTASAHFQSIGQDLPGVTHQAGTVKVDQQITARQGGQNWLLAADRPVRVKGASALVDPQSGVLINRTPVPAGAHYDVRSAVPVTSPSCRVAAAVAPSGPQMSVPHDLVNVALTLTAGATSPCTRAQSLADGLHHGYRFDAKAPSGSNIQILRNFVLGNADNGGGQGTSEQFASAFAFLGRSLGLDTRVVVGFRAAGQANQTSVLRGGDAQAWPEVNFVGVGWVAFDPTPLPNEAAHPIKPIEGSTSAGSPTNANPAGNGPPAVEAVPRLPPHPHHRSSSSWSTWWKVALVVIAVAALVLVALIIAVAVARRRRRDRRRHSPDRRGRVLGAWRQSLDTLGDAGVAGDPAFTAAQVIQAGGARLGGSAPRELVSLGALVNEAVYGPVEPDDSAIARAWAHADRLTAAGLASLTPRERVRRAVDVRVLVRSP